MTRTRTSNADGRLVMQSQTPVTSCRYQSQTVSLLVFFLPQVFSTIDISIDTHWTDLTDFWPDRFLLLIGFVLVLVLG